MKQLLFLIPLLLLFGIDTTAQATNDTIYQVGVTRPLSTRTRVLADRVGETLVICDKVYSSRIINEKIKSLNVGADTPDQIINIVLMGEAMQLDLQKLNSKKVCFKGIISLRKGKTHMIITHLDQITDYKQYL
jgi:hypothetical protein